MDFVFFAFYAACVAAALLVTVLLLHRFAAPGRVSPLVLAVVGYAWLTSLSVVALVPVDVLTTLARGGDPSAVLLLWKVSYWSTQLLTWALIPLLQNYSLAGAFTVAGRLRWSLLELWRFWLVMILLVVAGVLLAVALGRLRLSTLPQLVVLLSNTYGLVAIMALLGYGLVEVPRVLWRRSFPESRFKWHLHRVGRAFHRFSDAASELERCLAVVLITSQQVPRADAALRARADDLVAYADSASPVPPAALASSKSVDVESLEERDLDYAGDEEGLARLRGRLKLAIANFVGSHGEYVAFVRKAVELEAVCKSRSLGVCLPPAGEGGGRLAGARWWYKCRVRPHVQRCAALAAATASALIVWCEATIGSDRHPDLSPFSLVIHSQRMLGLVWVEQVVVAAPLAYACACCYFSLFKLGSLGPYHMVPGATWSWSLLLNASLLARFAAPLCFNYLHVVRMTGPQPSGRRMAFVELMGMEDVPLLGTAFNTWFPLVMVIYVAIITTSICENAAAKLFVAARFRFDVEKADDEHTERGSRLMQAEHDAVAAGREIGEGSGLFGLGPTGAAGAGARRTGGPSGSVPASSPEAGVGGSVELHTAREGAIAARPPLFGGAAAPEALERGGYGAWDRRREAGAAAGGASDPADALFAGVGRRGGRAARS